MRHEKLKREAERALVTLLAKVQRDGLGQWSNISIAFPQDGSEEQTYELRLTRFK